jgi:hypothetical protein
VAVYKIDLNFALKPFINELMNATALTFDEQGTLYISSRYDGFRLSGHAQRQYERVCGRNGRSYRHCVR